MTDTERATEDLLIEREDLGGGCHTLIVKGDPIPAHLAGLPRQPRTQPDTKKGRR